MRARHLTGVDASTRFVRVTGTTRGGFVEFQFSIGDPSLYLEMILPPSAFEEFCANNKAIHLTPEQGQAVDADQLRWREGKPADGSEPAAPTGSSQP